MHTWLLSPKSCAYGARQDRLCGTFTTPPAIQATLARWNHSPLHVAYGEQKQATLNRLAPTGVKQTAVEGVVVRG